MKTIKSKLVLAILVGLLITATALAVPYLKEVTGATCGKYMTLPTGDKLFPYENRIWYNVDSTCFCPTGTKIPIWMLDENKEFMMAYTCKEI